MERMKNAVIVDQNNKPMSAATSAANMWPRQVPKAIVSICFIFMLFVQSLDVLVDYIEVLRLCGITYVLGAC